MEREELKNICAELKIVCTAEAGAAKGPHPNWAGKGKPRQEPPQNWRVVLRYGKRSYTTDFYGGGSVPTPDAATVLGCLCSDAMSAENARDLEDWCSDLGYDPDSRTAERTYKQCLRTADRLRQFLGDSFDRCVRAEY